MGLLKHVYRSGSEAKYEVRIAIPKPLRKRMGGKREVKSALGTSDEIEAARLALPIITAVKTEIASAKRLRPLTASFAFEAIADWQGEPPPRPDPALYLSDQPKSAIFADIDAILASLIPALRAAGLVAAKTHRTGMGLGL